MNTDPAAHATKRGPGRKHRGSDDDKAPRVMLAPEQSKKLKANVGGSKDQSVARRIWREGEPVHIVKPVRAARRA